MSLAAAFERQRIIQRLKRLWFGGRLLIGNYTTSGDREPRPRLLSTVTGAQFELYEPRGQVRKTVMLVTGVGVRGEAEPRLIRMARSLAALGMRVVVPLLPGLRELRFEQSDLALARECLRHIRQVYKEPLAAVAVSTGGSIALTLSAEPEFVDVLPLILLFSPICDPPATWQTVDQIARTPIADLQAADDEIWIHMVNAYRHAEILGFTPTEKQAINEHLKRYMVDLTTAEKIAFYQNVIAARPMNGHTALDEAEALRAVSPMGKVSRSRARVLVIHDANDFVIPNDHILALKAELDGRAVPDNRILITPALSHVTLKPAYFFDILTMLDMTGELFS